MKRRYSVNRDNRLIIKPAAGKKNVVADGDFRINNNRLEYWLNEPTAWRRIHSLPPKIAFSGNWRVNSNYDLELILDKTKNQFQGDCLTLKGNILSTGRDILAFETKSYDRNGLLHIQILQLSVIWLTDDDNRLSFIVKKRCPDIITLEGNWQINRNQQITYTYEKTELKTKTKVSRILGFEGFWQINKENKLTYIFKQGPDSKFEFRGQIESPNIRPAEGLIKYRLGAGLKKTAKTGEKIISLYGIWKFSSKLGLSFQVDYCGLKMPDINFGADVTLNRKNELVFSLMNAKGKSLGINVLFTHKFLKSLDAEVFLRLKESCQEQALNAGVRIPF